MKIIKEKELNLKYQYQYKQRISLMIKINHSGIPFNFLFNHSNINDYSLHDLFLFEFPETQANIGMYFLIKVISVLININWYWYIVTE